MGAGEDESSVGNKVRSTHRQYIWTWGVCTWTWGKYGAVQNYEARNRVTWLDLSFQRSQIAMWRKKAWGGVGRDRASWLKGCCSCPCYSLCEFSRYQEAWLSSQVEHTKYKVRSLDGQFPTVPPNSTIFKFCLSDIQIRGRWGINRGISKFRVNICRASQQKEALKTIQVIYCFNISLWPRNFTIND